MNKENTEKLYKDFPELYKEKDLSIQESSMAFGFQCDDGWFELIYWLSKVISHFIEADKIDVTANTVKEKFGELRFYTNISHDYISGAVDLAEYLSRRICEKCGSTKNVETGKVKGQMRIKTLCKNCRG